MINKSLSTQISEISEETDLLKVERIKLDIERRKLQREDFKIFLLPYLSAIPLIGVVLSIVFGLGQCSSTKADKKELMRLIYEKGASKEDVIKTWNNLFPDEQWLEANGDPKPKK